MDFIKMQRYEIKMKKNKKKQKNRHPINEMTVNYY